MATAVFLHAHPDDESVMTAGTMARLSAEGHRVVLVTATTGHTAKYPEGMRSPRETELEEASAVLGVEDTRFLGYKDSGMAGDPQNFVKDSFFQSCAFEAADRLTAIMEETEADLLVSYDPNSYGHPDHIKCHIVGQQAAAQTGTPVIWATYNRESYEMLIQIPELMDHEWHRRLTDQFWTPGDKITHKIDVSDFLGHKKRAMRRHRDIDADHFFWQLSEEQFAAVFGTEWYASPTGSETVETSIF